MTPPTWLDDAGRRVPTRRCWSCGAETPDAGGGAAVIAEFIDRDNREWLIERLDFRTPAQARAEGWRAAA